MDKTVGMASFSLARKRSRAFPHPHTVGRMSAGVDDPATPGTASEGAEAGHHHLRDLIQEHHVLIEPEEDRWRWRARIRRNPHQLRVYRVAVAIAGLFFIVAGLVTGPLPGPGGIPLVLLGLAIWASEFEWAHKLMLWFKLQLHRFRGWSRPKQVLFWVVFFACCGLFGYLYLLTIGPPTWLPLSVDRLLERLPGV